MYNFSGIYYQILSHGLIFGIGGLMFLISSHFLNSEKRNMKNLLIGILCCILFVCSLGYYLFAINKRDISVYEGYFVEEHRESPYLFINQYCFSNGEKIKPVFHLDDFSKKKIYPSKFEINVRYRIFYEENTDIIIRVEKI